MKLVTLMENTTGREDLTCEHGLSLYIEACGKKILFDAGQTGAFADNAQKLGVDLKSVDLAILSHGHYDHSGGLMRFLQINDTAKVYVHKDAFNPHFNSTGSYIGPDPKLLETGRVICNIGTLELAPGLTLTDFADAPQYYPVDSAGLQMEVGGEKQPEDFRHEQYLLIREGRQTICISGCSHKGILNITKWAAPDVLVGGFHFMNIDPQGPEKARLDEAAGALLKSNAVFYTGHCTGAAPYEYLKERMDTRLHYISTGAFLEV
ncbi:MAG: MBL fold metallo-hydrolase [Oscillospiraceae bacterium]|nr:MBL fold metallo-hydrolase [Oscillospiraceae bacterium]